MFGKPENSKLLKDSKGRWRLRGLFYEQTLPADREEFQPPFTLKEEDLEVDGVFYRSLHQMYLESEDITEYTVAMEALGSWNHWKKLSETKWFPEYLSQWREELEIKLRSKAIKSMIKTAINEGSKGTTAAKFVAQKGWESNQGRPSKAKIDKEAKVQARIIDELDDDIERMQEHMH